MGYDISGVKNKERQREKLSADCGWKPAWEQTDKNKAAINILKGKDEVESLDFSNVLAEGKYNTLSSKAEAYLSYKADSDVNAAGAKEVSLATSADNAKDGNFVNSVITDEDVWEGTIKFEKYEDGVYKVVKVDKDGNRVVMGYADEKSKQNFYHGAAQEVKNSVKDGSGVDKSGNNSSKSTNTNISDGDSDSNEVSKDNKSTKKKGIDDTEVSGNGTTTSGGNNNNNSNLSGSDNSSNNSSVAAQKSAKELSAEIAAARENLSKAAKISDKITVSEKKLGTLLEKMQTENLSTDDLKEVKKYYKDIYKSYKNTLKQREDDLKNGDLSKEEKKVCKNDIKILEEACSFFKSKYYTVEYDNDMKNQEAVNYNSNIEIDNDALEKSMEKVSLPSGVHYQYDYKKYCELVGKDKAVSPLDFYKAVKKKEGECSNIPETYLGDTGNTDLLKRISDTDKSLSTISKANGNDSSISVYSNLYNYYYYTQGAEAAEKYAIKMKEQFNSINGTAEAIEKNNMLTYDLNSGKGGKLMAQIHALFDKMTYGAGNVGTGAVNAIKAIAGGKDQEVQTQKDFEKEYFSQLLNERGSDFAFINKYGETLGEMATYSVLAALTGPLTAAGGGAAAAGEAATTASSGGAIASVTNFASKGINSKLAMASFQGLTTFGNLYHSTRVEGNDHESSFNYAAISGISSTAFEYIMGGIIFFGKKAGKYVAEASGLAEALKTSGIKDGLSKVGPSIVFGLGKDSLREGIQEVAETLLDALVLRNIILDEKSSWEDIGKNVLESFISGGFISMITNTSHVAGSIAMGAAEVHDARSSRIKGDINVEGNNGSRSRIKELQSDYDGKSREYDKKKAEFDAYEKKLDEEGIGYTDRYLDKTYNEKLDELQQAENELELSKKKLEDVKLEEQNNIQKKGNSDADLDNNTEKHKHDGEGIGISLNGKHDKKRLSGVVNTLKSKLGSLKGIETLKKIKSTFDVSNTKEKIKELQRDYENKKARFEEHENELEEKGMGYSDRYVDEEYIKRFDELQLAKKKLELSKKKLKDVELEEQKKIQKKDNSDIDLNSKKHNKKKLSGVINTLKSKLGSLKGIETLKKIKSAFDNSNSIEKIKELQSDYDGKSRKYDKKKADELQQAKNELELSKKKLEDVELEEQNNIQKKDNSDAKQSESVSSLRSLQRISYEEIKDMNSNQIRKKFLKDVPILSDSALVKKFANIFAKKGRIDYKDLVYTENKKPPTKEAIAAYDDYFSSPEIRQKLTQYDQDQGGYLRHYYTKEYPGFDKGINNRFYLNLEGNDVLKFNKLFVEECLSENLPFYFKSGVYSKKYFDTHKEICSPKLLKRSDSVIIYCMKEDCGDMFRIIKKIQNENPDISFLEPPLATGKVDVGIGYGFEMKYTSYNDRKAEEISGVLERVSKAFKEKYGNSNLETINEHFDDYLKMVNKKANELNCNSYLSEDDKELLSLSAAGDKSSVVGDKSNAVADIIANKLVMQKIKLNNGKRFSSPSELLDYVCRSMGDVGAERLYELYGKVTKKGKLDYDDWMFITDKNNSREAVMSLYASSPTLNHFCNYIGTFLENYSSNTSNKKFIDNRNYNIGETERFFEKYRASDGTIGVDQGVIKGLVVYADSKGNEYSYQQVLAMCAAARKQGKPLPHFKTRIGNTEYFYLKNKLESLGFNYIDSQVILDSIDVGFGACTDAATGDAILNKFKSNPELFQKTFGYSMYKKDKGKLKLNSSELLLDLYLFANDKKNGGNLFYTSADGKKNIDPMYISYNVDSLGRDILDGKKKRNFFGSYLAADEMTNNFLKSKSSKFEYYGDYIFRNLQETNRKSLNSLELDNVIKKVDSAINKGKSVTIGVCSDEKNPVKFIPLDKNRAIVKASKTEWGEGAGHEVCIIGKNKDGFIVSSWGGKYLISFDDLSHGRIDIHSSDIKLI